MSDELNTTFTTEQLLLQAQGNLAGILLITATFLKEHNISLTEYTEYMGRKFAPGWGKIETAQQVAYSQALNFASFGIKLHELSGDESEAKIVMSGWPDKELLEFSGVTQEDADTIWQPMKVIAEHLGFNYDYVRQGDIVTITLSRRDE